MPTLKNYVRAQLRRMRLVPLSIKMEQSKTSSDIPSFSLEYFYYRDKDGKMAVAFSVISGLKHSDLAVYSRQFASMLASGVAMMKCLEILRDQQEVA